jgi:hypothetical protein
VVWNADILIFINSLLLKAMSGIKSALLLASVALGAATDTTTIYTLEGKPDCGQVDFPTAYLKEAQAFDKNLIVGTCASVGYTVPDGETTKTEPVIGTITIKKFLKPSEEAVGDIWSNCGSSSDILSDATVTIVPDPPVKGKDITVTASGNIKSEITGGNINAVIDILGIPVINKNIDLCKASPKVTCPISAGHHSLEITQLIPSSVPSGSYTGKVIATDQNGKQINCVALTFKL